MTGVHHSTQLLCEMGSHELSALAGITPPSSPSQPPKQGRYCRREPLAPGSMYSFTFTQLSEGRGLILAPGPGPSCLQFVPHSGSLGMEGFPLEAKSATMAVARK
jgi:hypothetical protein